MVIILLSSICTYLIAKDFNSADSGYDNNFNDIKMGDSIAEHK